MPKSPDHAGGYVSPVDQAASNLDRLKLYFAILTCLGGLVLASGEGAELIPVVAVFFAVFGYLFVDWLKLFALPAVAAYILMGFAAVYCVSDFWKLETPGNQQMLSVAQLLVLVQAILMLQKKTPRIFEQLGVFCLLELVVAAVFNDPLVYGLLLLPIGMIGIWALALLSSVTASEGLQLSMHQGGAGIGLDSDWGKDGKSDHWMISSIAGRPRQSPTIRYSAANSVGSLSVASARMGRFAVMTLAPAILLVGAVFFYALPRTTDAARMEGRGNALVGFDDQMSLEQVGQMLQSNDPALRVRLTDRRSGRPYTLIGGMYLRGQVLEQYEPLAESRYSKATWSSVFRGASPGREPLPREFLPRRMSDMNFYDTISAEVDCESMRSPSLFTIAPYFRTKTDDAVVVHSAAVWTLSRRERVGFFYPRLRYSFGTNAFRDGVQTDMIAATGTVRGSYRRQVLQFDASRMPTIAKMAGEIRDSIPPASRTELKVAKAMESHLAFTGGYNYTLNLNASAVPGVDPIEQFMSIDRRGHCQYFASALVMMLRSLNIPARVVVGYRTDDFSEIGQYYVARQSDAHAWVEALLSQEQLGSERLVYGQPRSRQYWIRLDPTPGGGGRQRTAGGVEQVLSLARNILDEYVVDMDADRQKRAFAADNGNAMSGSYGSFIRRIQQKIAAIRAGGLGGGSLALRDAFSWRAATYAGIIATAVFLLIRLRWPRWIGRQIETKSALIADKPQIPFYADTLKQLSRLGITRRAAQTPREFSDRATVQLQAFGDVRITALLQVLTDEFCRQRYGDESTASDDTGDTLSQLTGQVDTLLSNPAFIITRQPSPMTEHHP